MQHPLDRLRALDLSAGPVLILTHDNPDPDSISSAAGLRLLLEHTHGVKAAVAYSGIVGRAENRAMVALLGLQLEHVDELVLSNFRYIALVDAQPFTGNSLIREGTPVDIVIDHHPIRETTKASSFYDVRANVGASATLVTEYLTRAGVTISTEIATALFYGIQSETQTLSREVSQADVDACGQLFSTVDFVRLAAISHPPVPAEYLQQLAVALGGALKTGRAVVCRLGEVPYPDFVPELAELTIRVEQIEWSLALGRSNNRLFLSLRSSGQGVNAGIMMQALVEGRGSGGGHGLRAGGSVDFSGDEEAADLERGLIRRFLTLAGESEGELAPIGGEGRI